MDAKQAVRTAKKYLLDLLADEQPSNLGLEELEYDDANGQWLVTLGFSRPWNSVRNALTALSGESAPKRAYRVLAVDADSSEVVSMKRKSSIEAD